MDTFRTNESSARDRNDAPRTGESTIPRQGSEQIVDAVFARTPSPERERRPDKLLGNPALVSFFEEQEAEWAALSPEQVADSDLQGYLSDDAPRGMRLSETPIVDSERTRDLLQVFADQFKGRGEALNAVNALHAAHDEAGLLSYFEELMDAGAFEEATSAYMAAMHDYLPARRIVAYAERCFSGDEYPRGFSALEWIGDAPSDVLRAFGDRAAALGLPDIAKRFHEKAEERG